jgi:hypothetical protein
MIESRRTTGSRERRPSASRMPNGSENDDPHRGDQKRHENPTPQGGRDLVDAEEVRAREEEVGEDRKMMKK